MKTWDPDDYDKYEGEQPKVNWTDRTAWGLLLLGLVCSGLSAWLTR